MVIVLIRNKASSIMCQTRDNYSQEQQRDMINSIDIHNETKGT